MVTPETSVCHGPVRVLVERGDLLTHDAWEAVQRSERVRARLDRDAPEEQPLKMPKGKKKVHPKWRIDAIMAMRAEGKTFRQIGECVELHWTTAARIFQGQNGPL